MLGFRYLGFRAEVLGFRAELSGLRVFPFS